LGALALGAGLAARPIAAQEPTVIELASPEELYDLVGPIALYPDDLVAIVLPASTYPLQVVQAARFLEDRKRDSNLEPDGEWDDSIVALLNYPEVVALLNDDLDWTYDLGEAVLNQRADVLDAIQDFREEAYAAGNLRTDDRQTVARDDGTIEITPANPQVIYVPYYEPERVVIYQTVPVYHYYPRRYNVVVNVNITRDRVWEPRYRYGGRPVVRASEGRVATTYREPRRGVLDSSATRTREGSVYRAPGSTAATSDTAATRQPRRGVPSSSYRSRIEATERATQAAQESRPAPIERSATVQQRERGVVRPAPTREGTYRSGGGTAQALERARVTAPTRDTRSSTAVSPRAVERSTGMPREASRSAPQVQRESAPAVRAPTHGGVSSQSSGGDGGSYRGGSSQRGEPSAARGRSAGR
jgi:hypothetical protein